MHILRYNQYCKAPTIQLFTNMLFLLFIRFSLCVNQALQISFLRQSDVCQSGT
ncbi:Uncharacterized protein EbC_pEb17201820 (plasmid) [Erwinia billingiae Eb661]|uniref:Uncharacterized protein n=1 Tax=Erwinia billingiae (strain Eb661) TaxID=634500 RepID=D8MK37_ERWBE|nr:Uncharacterized protein EbC_pEb17201820 [Erwinia billingiae Eb661]